MAEAPRRKKLEKTVDDSTTIQTSQKFYCCRCGTSYSRKKGYFPVSHSPMYRGSGFLPMCNDCVEDMYEQYRAMLGDDKAAMKRMCMKLDLYWNEDIYAMVERTAGVHSRVRNYIGKTNIIRYIDKTFDDTLDEEALLEPEETPAASYIAQPEDTAEADVDQALVDFWGAGYTPDFYLELERRYKDWTGDRQVIDPSERALYRQICLLESIIARDSAQGKPIDKNVNALNSLLGSMHTEDQALVIRKLYDEYSCDYIVLDCTGLGLGVYDALVRDMVDPDTGEVYPALSCCNNQEMADRCTTKGADKVIWAIKGSPMLNSECAVLLREGFRSSKIRLLITEYDGEALLSDIKGYNSLSPLEKVTLQKPYVHTTLLIDELVKLQHEESGGRVRVYEKSGMRKDRYSSLSYNYYVALQLESKYGRTKTADFNANDIFMFKPPKLK